MKSLSLLARKSADLSSVPHETISLDAVGIKYPKIYLFWID